MSNRHPVGHITTPKHSWERAYLEYWAFLGMSCGCVVKMKCSQVGEHSAEQFLKTTNDFYRNYISECYLLMQIHPNAKWTHVTSILAMLIWSTAHALGVHGGITCHKLQGKCFTRMTALSACFVNSPSASLDVHIHLFTLCSGCSARVLHNMNDDRLRLLCKFTGEQ